MKTNRPPHDDQGSLHNVPWPGVDRYGVVTILLLISILAYALTPSNMVGQLAAVGVEGLTLLFIARLGAGIAGARRVRVLRLFSGRDVVRRRR